MTVTPPTQFAAVPASTDADHDHRTSPAMNRTDRYTPPADDVVAHVRAQVAAWPPLTPAQVSLLAHAFAPAITPETRREAVA